MRIAIGLLILIVLIAACGLVVGPVRAVTINPELSGPVPGKFIVKLSSKANAAALTQALSSTMKLERLLPQTVSDDLVGYESFSRIHVFYDTQRTLAASDVLRALGQKNVEYIEPDYYLEFFDFPDDSLFANQWYLYNEGQEYLGIDRQSGPNNDSLILKTGLSGADINMEPLYTDPPTEATRVVVAIIDSGVDLMHPELQGSFWSNPDEIAGNGIDDDHNGYVDDTLGYDVSGDIYTLALPKGDNGITDSVGHGTHIAGIIAAAADGHGVVGLYPNVAIMPVKIRPNATVAVSAAGILYAVIAGAQILNLSWGTNFESSTLRDAIELAQANGVMVVAAAGNSGSNERFFPAAFESVFVVGAGDAQGKVTTFSTFGSHIDLVAPGLDILSLRASGTDMYARANEPGTRIIGSDSLYYLSDGTSMAAPMVVGAAARLLSYRPDLSLSQLQLILRQGADDIVDPYGIGDSLPGPDTISGFGYLNVHASLILMNEGGIYFVDPVRHDRYSGEVDVRIAPIAGYTGAWILEFSVGAGSQDWQPLSEGSFLPEDSVAFRFIDKDLAGQVNLRLTDRFGKSVETQFTYVRQNVVDIFYPLDGEELKYNIPIYGSVYGPEFDSMIVLYRRAGEASKELLISTGEYFDSMMVQWSASGSDTGTVTIFLYGYFATETVIDSVTINVTSAFSEGWPRHLAARGGISPVVADLDHDGTSELIVATTAGIYVYTSTGELLEGFPVLPDKDMRSVPAVYDIDGDGEEEIICTNEDGLHAFNRDGSYVPGWPRSCLTGLQNFGYGFPNPTITQLGQGEDSAIVIINKIGQILAWEFNGDPYFYSLEGMFASFDSRITDMLSTGGDNSPFVSSADLDGDGTREVVASYTSPPPYTGLGLFDARTGQPAFERSEPLVTTIRKVYGTTITDLDGDGLPEIVTLGYDSTGLPHLWAKTQGLYDLPGFPIELPAVKGWIGQYPIVADLDLDGRPEIILSFFEYDVGTVYIFRSDGSPYLAREGHPGEAFYGPTTFGNVVAADLTGDEKLEIVFRGGHIIPGSGPELVYILDYQAVPINGWPVTTPTRPMSVLSSRQALLVDDLDGDGLVELILVSDGADILVWDFDASYQDGKNIGKFLVDNLNSGIVQVEAVTTHTEESDETVPLLPTSLILDQNYPNPFNPVTTITFSLPATSEIALVVYNILGQEVAMLAEGVRSPGDYTVTFDASGLASGIYFYRLKTQTATMTRKMVLSK